MSPRLLHPAFLLVLLAVGGLWANPSAPTCKPLAAHTVAELVAALKLEPHPNGTGYFQRIYTSPYSVSNSRLGAPRPGPPERLTGTVIYSLLLPTYSTLHRLRSDELILFLAGDPIELLRLHPDGTADQCIIGPDLAAGQVSFALLKAGTWMGYQIHRQPGALGYSLVAAPVVPGFAYADFEHSDAGELVKKHPAHAALIRELKHNSQYKH